MTWQDVETVMKHRAHVGMGIGLVLTGPHNQDRLVGYRTKQVHGGYNRITKRP